MRVAGILICGLLVASSFAQDTFTLVDQQGEASLSPTSNSLSVELGGADQALFYSRLGDCLILALPGSEFDLSASDGELYLYAGGVVIRSAIAAASHPLSVVVEDHSVVLKPGRGVTLVDVGGPVPLAAFAPDSGQAAATVKFGDDAPVPLSRGAVDLGAKGAPTEMPSSASDLLAGFSGRVGDLGTNSARYERNLLSRDLYEITKWDPLARDKTFEAQVLKRDLAELRVVNAANSQVVTRGQGSALDAQTLANSSQLQFQASANQPPTQSPATLTFRARDVAESTRLDQIRRFGAQGLGTGGFGRLGVAGATQNGRAVGPAGLLTPTRR